MSFLDEEDYNNISNINWDEDDFNLSIAEIEEQRDLIAKSNKIEDEDTPTDDVLEVLRKFFGHKEFRPMQWKIISSIIKDRRDNCAVMATGYGKSLCFQFPSVYCGGITIVISPLISLMQDQVLSLEMANIPACFLGSAQNKQKKVIQDILENKYFLVYLTPEFCCGEYGQDLLKQINNELSITLIAIDEAHCVSTWGHDFRFQYRELGSLRKLLPNVPILAVTATATMRVRNDIVNSLGLRNAQVLCSGFDRPNLYFSVFMKGNSGPMADLQKYMVKKDGKFTFTGSTIIYCITRKQTEEIADILNSNGITCAPYHASLGQKKRAETHEMFVKDKLKIIVATIAFGMGIDKPDVRRIIHYGSSKDLESYYQEVGRAGRDGQPAECVTFYSHADFEVLRALQEANYGSSRNKEHKEAMTKLIRNYFDTRECRRQFILNHFEGTPLVKNLPKPRCCDNCTRKLTSDSDHEKYEGLDSENRYDFTEDTTKFLKAVQALHNRFGLGLYIQFLRGSKVAKLAKFHSHSLHGSGKKHTENWWKGIGNLLLREKFLQKVQGNVQFSTLVKLSTKGEMFLQDVIKRPHLAKLIITPPNDMFSMLKVKKSQQLEVEQSYRRPSTSKEVVTRKVNLKKLTLLKPSTADSTQSVIRDEDDNEESSEIQETQFERNDRMEIFKKLEKKRIDIALEMDCMPYMVASNQALMQMARVKPITMSEFQQGQFQGFNAAKIAKFGPHLVRTIRTLCKLDPELPVESKKTIEDILRHHPLASTQCVGMAAEATYKLFKEGLMVAEIAKKRGCVPSSVMSHLIDCLKVGRPIKLIDLNITDEERNAIIAIIAGPKIKFNMTLMTPIKMLCSPDTALETIKAVVAYVSIREHLKRLHIPYEDFEEPYEDILQIATLTRLAKNPSENNECTSTTDALGDLIKWGKNELNDELIIKEEIDIKEETHEVKNIPKVIKMEDFAFKKKDLMIKKEPEEDLTFFEKQNEEVFKKKDLKIKNEPDEDMTFEEKKIKKRSHDLDLDLLSPPPVKSYKRIKPLSQSSSDSQKDCVSTLEIDSKTVQNIQNNITEVGNEPTTSQEKENTNNSLNKQIDSNLPNSSSAPPKKEFKFKKLTNRPAIDQLHYLLD